jgi:hypothetical protein
MPPEPRRSASDYEQQLRRHELAAGRALTQVLPAGGQPTARQLAEARRALTRQLRDLRGLRRELDQDLRRLRGEQSPAAGGPAPPGRARAGGPPAAGGGSRPRAPRRRPPEELFRLEAAGNAIDEVLDRWEARQAQLASEIERRSTRKR